jgi:hypothetical protein
MAKKPALKLVNKPKVADTPKTSKPRLTDEQKSVIYERLMAGETALALAAEFGVSNATIGAIKKSFSISSGGASDMPTAKESPLRVAIYLYGFKTLMGEEVPPEEVAELKAKIAAKQAEMMKQLALAI